jgi:hypothetical protein
VPVGSGVVAEQDQGPGGAGQSLSLLAAAKSPHGSAGLTPLAKPRFLPQLHELRNSKSATGATPTGSNAIVGPPDINYPWNLRC